MALTDIIHITKTVNELVRKTAPWVPSREKELAAALGLYETLMQFEGDMDINTASEAYFYKGFAHGKLGKLEEAILNYDKAIELKPNYAVAYNNRGVAKQELGRHEDALPDLDKAIELDPNNAAAYNNRGVAKQELGRHEEAILDLDKAIELEPKSSHSYSWRGSIYEQQGETEKAKANYQTALQQLQEIPGDKLHKNNIGYLIGVTEGLTRLGEDLTEKVEKYHKLAEERGYKF